MGATAFGQWWEKFRRDYGEQCPLPSKVAAMAAWNEMAEAAAGKADAAKEKALDEFENADDEVDCDLANERRKVATDLAREIRAMKAGETEVRK